MRFPFVIGFGASLALAAAMAPLPAAAAGLAPWCLQSLPDDRSASCSFGSLDQCLRVIGAFGGKCARNTRLNDEPARPGKPRAPRRPATSG